MGYYDVYFLVPVCRFWDRIKEFCSLGSWPTGLHAAPFLSGGRVHPGSWPLFGSSFSHPSQSEGVSQTWFARGLWTAFLGSSPSLPFSSYSGMGILTSGSWLLGEMRMVTVMGLW